LSNQTRHPDLIPFAISMAKRIANRVQFREEFKVTMEVADLEQEFLVFVLERIDQFDEEKGNHEAFVNLLIRNCIAKLCRESHRQRSSPPCGSQVESTDQVIKNDDGMFEEMFRSLGIDDKDRRTLGTTRDPLADLENSEEIEHRIRTLPVGYRGIARRLMKSSQTEVASLMGLTKRQLNDAMKVIRKHFADLKPPQREQSLERTPAKLHS
jgi:RNA polymerase sigma factor (sigma-70 family)